jgi:hypothetical protein
MKLFGGKWGLFLRALIFVIILAGLKIGIHYLSFEFLDIGTLTSSLVAGVFFVIAIILAGVLSDFKESEKMLADLASSIENLHLEAQLICRPEEVSDIRSHIRDLVRTCIENFNRRNTWQENDVENAIDRIESDVRNFNEQGRQISVLLRLRTELSSIKKMSSRIEVIKETSFLPAARLIAQLGVASVISVLVLSKMAPFWGGVLLLSLLALVLASVLFLITDMDNPFEGYVGIDLRAINKLKKFLE